MPLVLGRVEEADIATTIVVERTAFRSGGGISLVLSPSPEISPAELEASAERRRKTLREDPFAHLLKVTDTETGQIVAFAHWDISLEERTQEQLEHLTEVRPPPPDANKDAWNDFFVYLSDARRNTLGTKPAAFLKILTTLPDHHRRGAGSLLLKYGCDKADDAGIRAYLEASGMGKPLYERFGFKVVYSQEFPLDKYGGTGVDKNYVMERPARSGQENLNIPSET